MSLKPNTLIGNANFILRDGLHAFHEAWWLPDFGQDWHLALSDMSKQLHKEQKVIINQIDPNELSDLFLATTIFWEGTFSKILEPYIKQLRLRNAMTFRSRIEQAREYHNLHAHQEVFSMEEAVDVLREYKTVLSVFAAHEVSVMPALERLQVLFDQTEHVYTKEKYGTLNDLNTKGDDAVIDQNQEKKAEDTERREATEDTEPTLDVPEAIHFERPETSQEEEDVLTKVSPIEEADYGSDAVKMTEPAESTTGAWWSKLFSKKPTPTEPQIRTRDKKQVADDILDELVKIFNEYKKNNAELPFNGIHILVLATQHMEIYQDYFVAEKMGIPAHLNGFGLGSYDKIPISFEVVDNFSSHAEGNVLSLAERNGFLLKFGDVHKNIQTRTAPASRKARIEVCGGELEGRIRNFVLEPNPPKKITIGRKRDVFDQNGYIERKNVIAFQDNEQQKTIHKKHAHILFDENSNTFRIYPDPTNQNGLSVFNRNTNLSRHVLSTGTNLKEGDEVQIRLNTNGVVLLKFSYQD